MRRLAVLLVVVLIAAGLYVVASKGGPAGLAPTPTAVAGPSSTPGPSTATPTLARTPASTLTSTPTLTSTASPTPIATASPTATASATVPPTPSASPQPTPMRVVSTDGYSLSLPGGWVALQLNGGDVSGLLALLGQSQPGISQLIKTYLDLSGAKVSLVGLDPAGTVAGGLPAGAFVLLQPTLGFSLDLVASVVGGVLNRIPGLVGAVQREKVHIASGDAVRFTFDVAGAGSGGETVNARLVQYLVVRGSQGYVVTFTTSADHVDRDTPLFDAIIGSLTFP